MRRIIISFFICLAFSILPVEAQNQTKKFKLGVILPLSGDLAFFGKAHLNTAEMFKGAQEKLEYEIVYEDSAYDVKKAVTAYKKLSTIDKVDAIFSFGGPMLAALAPLAERDKLPLFASESESTDVDGRKYVFLFRNEIGEFGRVIWDELRSQGKKSIGIVKNRNQFMATFARGIIENAREGEVASVEIDVDPGSTDLRTQLLRLKKSKFDILGVLFLPGSHRAFLNQARTLAIKYPMIGVEEFLLPEENLDLDDYIDGTLIVTPYVTEDFRKDYKEKFSSDLGIEYGVEYYDFLKLLNATLAKEPYQNREKFISAMQFSGESQGLSGPFSVKKTAKGGVYYSFPIAIYKIEKGKLLLHKLYERPE